MLIMVNPEIRYKVIQLYKTLLYMGKDYPKGYMYFRDRCHNAFMKNKDVKDSEQILKLVTHGQFVVKELEALYFLKKYRTMKNRYYKDEEKDADVQKFEEISNPKRDS